jgi:HEAT repeat protein
MNPPCPTPDRVAPLLLELARAFRARQFYPPTHPALREALERTGSVWIEALAEVGELRLELRHGLFAIPGGRGVQGPGIDEVAQELARRRVKRLRIHPGVRPEELAALIDALSDPDLDETDPNALEAVLERANVQHITTREVGPAAHVAGEAAGAEPAGGPMSSEVASLPEPRGGELPAAAPRDPPRQPGEWKIGAAARGSEAEDASADRGELSDAPESEQVEAQAGSRELGTSDERISLVQQVEELEACDDPGIYSTASLQLLESADQLLLARDYAGAYRAALAFAGHVLHTQSRSPLLRDIARERLSQLLRSDEMLGFVLEGTASDSGIGNLKATEVLLCVGASIVPRLLEVHAQSEPEMRSHISAVLIVMGDVAFPVLVGELVSRDGARLRRAARILGDMQHPRGVEFLAEHLRDPDAHVKKEVAMALTRIGTKRALEHLLRALHGDAATAQIAAASLGNVRSDAAVAALVAVVEPGGDRPDEVRREAIRSLGRIGRREATPTLARVLERASFFGRKRSRALRVAAAHALGRIGGGEAQMLLARHARRGDRLVRQACSEALQILTRMADA